MQFVGYLFEFIFTYFEQPDHRCQICFIPAPHLNNRLGRPILLLHPCLVPTKIHNTIDRKSLNTASCFISDPAFEFHLPWNENFVVSGGQSREPRKNAEAPRPRFFISSFSTARSLCTIHLSGILFILGPLHYLILGLLNGLLFTLLNLLPSCRTSSAPSLQSLDVYCFFLLQILRASDCSILVPSCTTSIFAVTSRRFGQSPFDFLRVQTRPTVLVQFFPKSAAKLGVLSS